MKGTLKTRIFDMAQERGIALPMLAKAMGLDRTFVWRVKAGHRRINEAFITGAKAAFPKEDLGHLFYIESGEETNVA